MSGRDAVQRARPYALAEHSLATSPLECSDAEAIVRRIVKMSRADSIFVRLEDLVTTNLRFADNRVTTAGWVRGGGVSVTSAFGAKHAAVRTDDVSDAGLRAAVAQSEKLARLAPDDPESMPPLPPQRYRSSKAYSVPTEEVSADDRVHAAMTAIAPARAQGLQAAGYMEIRTGASVIGNSAGLFGYHPYTTADYTLTVRSDDGTGSGWAGAEVNDWRELHFAALGERAIAKALASRHPAAIEPGRYTVILEPQAVGDLVQLVMGYMSARRADEGRSPFSKSGGGTKVGERIVDRRVSILSDPFDPELRAQPFDGDGVPLGRQLWIDRGVLHQLYYTRFWGKKKGHPPTGAPHSFKMAGGTASVEEMVRSTERGILVTRLWYLREVDPRTALFTGLTRDGTFLVEGGKVTKGVKNLRFNESPLFLLANVEALGRPERIGGSEGDGPVVVPPIKARDFLFTSASDAV